MGQMPGRRGSDPLQPDNWRSGSGQLRTAAPAGKQFLVLTLHRSTPLDPSSTEQQDQAGAASQTSPAGPGAVGNEVPGIGGGLLLRTGDRPKVCQTAESTWMLCLGCHLEGCLSFEHLFTRQ